MFNYDDLKVTLTVTPEISPLNVYTKEEANNLFVKDVENNLAVYGRMKEKWVELASGDVGKLLAGFLSTNDASDFIGNEDYKKLDKFLFTHGDTALVHVDLNNDTDGNNIWICSTMTVTSIQTEQGLSISFESEGSVDIEEEPYYIYSIRNLKAGDYILVISVAQ